MFKRERQSNIYVQLMSISVFLYNDFLLTEALRIICMVQSAAAALNFDEIHIRNTVNLFPGIRAKYRFRNTKEELF